MSKISTQLGLAAVCLLLGILLVSQFRAQEKIAAELRAQSSQNQLTLLGSLIDSNAKLRDEVAKLEGQLRSLAATDGPDLEAMHEEVEQLRLLNGLTAARGTGVRVTLDASLESYWLQDLLNELRNAGAEAIAVNDRRIVAGSVIGGGANDLRLDGQPLARPYVVEAVGEPETLFTAVNRPGGLLLQLRAQYGPAAVALARQPDLRLPARSAATASSTNPTSAGGWRQR